MECWKSDVASFANPGIPGVWGQPYGVSLLEFFINVPVKLLELEALCYTRFMGFLRPVLAVRRIRTNFSIKQQLLQYDFLAGIYVLQFRIA